MVEQEPKRRRTIDPRPSYGSPTKASLARYNPNLLPEARSSPARKSPGISSASGDLLSHVLGAKAKKPLPKSRTSARNRISDLPASEPNDEQEGTPVVVEAETEDEEATQADMQTPTIEGGRFRGEMGEEDDLPETPSHLRKLPEYQDAPPQGILSLSLKKGRPNRGKDSRQTSRRTSTPPKTAEHDAQAIPAVPQLSWEEKMQLKKKQEELDELKEQLRTMKNDILQLEQHANSLSQLKDGQDYSKLADLVTLINRTNTSKKGEESEVNLLPVSTLLTSFLPFSIPLPEVSESHDDEPLVPSHAPLPDTPKLLNLFTPFNISCVLSAPSKPTKTQPTTEQIHTITLAISLLFSCTLALTVMSSSLERQQSVKSLEITYISPWANQEVGSWIRARAIEGDVNGIGYGLGRYWDLNIKRAQVWTRIIDEYPYLKPRAVGVLGSVTQDQEQAAKSQKRKRNADGELDVDSLNKFLGRDTLVCGDGVCQVRISWRLGFDWTSEVESRVYLRLTFPRSGAESAEQKTLRQSAQISFHQLLSKHGVSFAAAKVLDSIFT